MTSTPRIAALTIPVLVAGLAGLGAVTGCGDDGDDGDTVNCALEDRDDEFLAGMMKTGAGGVTVTLVSATPAPPARNDNAWELQLATPAGPFEGTVQVVPFMPDHNHGTPIQAVVEPVAGTPGRFTASPINLFMPGLWEVTIRATPTGGTLDAVVFRFCVAS
ncbi:MAG: FixH family protein [Kofleriaceae bacterium]|nr:FixH family protein [Kofleriaceae bacterium]MCL4226888.1 FixH family protein [Myxococcales bacterium]